jgi:hypothetical protein
MFCQDISNASAVNHQAEDNDGAITGNGEVTSRCKCKQDDEVNEISSNSTGTPIPTPMNSEADDGSTNGSGTPILTPTHSEVGDASSNGIGIAMATPSHSEANSAELFPLAAFANTCTSRDGDKDSGFVIAWVDAVVKMALSNKYNKKFPGTREGCDFERKSRVERKQQKVDNLLSGFWITGRCDYE